jgi:hypothetical protein
MPGVWKIEGKHSYKYGQLVSYLGKMSKESFLKLFKMSVKSVRTYENKTWTQVEPKFQK